MDIDGLCGKCRLGVGGIVGNYAMITRAAVLCHHKKSPAYSAGPFMVGATGIEPVTPAV